MKKTVALTLLFACQIAFAASRLECDFTVVKKGKMETFKRSQELILVESMLPIGNGGLAVFDDNMTRIEFEDAKLKYKLEVTGSISQLGESIVVEIEDSKLGTLQRISGGAYLKTEIVRGTEFGIDSQTNGIAIVCSLE